MQPKVPLLIAFALLLVSCAPGSTEERTTELDDPPAAELPGAGAFIDEGPDEHLVYRPGEIQWEEAPASLERGAEVAILEGDPAEAGVFTMRIRMPDDFVIAPHWHPGVERVTVMSGTFLLGSGNEIDRQSAEALNAGGYTSIPPETTHFAIAEGETTIQLTSVGPWELTYADPEDDPR